MRRFILIVPFFFALTGCGVPANLPLIGSGAVAVKTASGLLQNAKKEVNATIDLGKMGITKAKQVASEGQQRVQKIEEGVSNITQGVDAIKKGVK
ncbi:hypothetical protein HY213_02260 [Candidatus Peregrinibacteria bacterium]|nr:hypothetical protein [Candidatus Peregrinibacteria bacterium]